MKIVFNEYQEVQKILQAHQTDLPIFTVIRLLVTYFHDLYNVSDSELIEMVNAELEKLDFEGYYYEKYYKTIKRTLNNVVKYEMVLKVPNVVAIHKKEQDVIETLTSRKHKKLLATLYVIAHWYDSSGWTSNKFTTTIIKKMANLNCTNKELDLLFYDLIQGDYIKPTKKASNFSYCLTSYTNDDEVVQTFDSFENVGNKYIANQTGKYIVCQFCGKLVVKKSPRQKYCNVCAENIRKAQNREYKRAERGN